jgi:hypothetical protein
VVAVAVAVAVDVAAAAGVEPGDGETTPTRVVTALPYQMSPARFKMPGFAQVFAPGESK